MGLDWRIALLGTLGWLYVQRVEMVDQDCSMDAESIGVRAAHYEFRGDDEMSVGPEHDFAELPSGGVEGLWDIDGEDKDVD